MHVHDRDRGPMKPLTMAKTALRALAVLALLLCFAHDRLLAQETVGLHITGLTTNERDALLTQVPEQSGMQVVYACLPAGVVVLRSTDSGMSRGDARLKARNAVARLVPLQRVPDEVLTLEEAEQQCAATRN